MASFAGNRAWSVFDGHWKKWLPRWPKANVESHMIAIVEASSEEDVKQTPHYSFNHRECLREVVFEDYKSQTSMYRH